MEPVAWRAYCREVLGMSLIPYLVPSLLELLQSYLIAKVYVEEEEE